MGANSLKRRSYCSFSFAELAIAITLLVVGLIPILTSMSAGRTGVVGTENRYFGEQYALELASALAILTPAKAKKFAADVNSKSTSSPYVKALSPLKKGFVRKVSYVSEVVRDKVDGVNKDITFVVFSIDIKIPAIKPGEFRHFYLQKLVRERV
ncbi:hypothetical protein ACFL35_05555 [Candidatus Riflebacteria bacterium]